MKNIFFYSPYLSCFGGGEKYFLTFLESVSNIQNTNVVLLFKKKFEKEKFEKYFSIDLSKIRIKKILTHLSILKHTKNADIFICLSNFYPIKSNAKHHIQLLQVPYSKINSKSILKKILSGKIKEATKDTLRLKLISLCKTSYDLTISNSEFVKKTFENNFNLKSIVVTPPIENFKIENHKKENIILSVGRFFLGNYNDKKYPFLTEAFKSISAQIPNWEYHIAGSVPKNISSKKFLNSLLKQNKNFPIKFHPNISFLELKKLYNRASIFWHGAGFDVDENKFPEQTEHFGMSTVEAMSCGTIPIVPNCGGQKEIVENNLDGFLWNKKNELINYTLQLIQDENFKNQIAENTSKKFLNFSKTHFQIEIKKIFQKFI